MDEQAIQPIPQNNSDIKSYSNEDDCIRYLNSI